MKQLVYNTGLTADDNDLVGAVLLAGSTELTATGTALDVNVASGALAVDLDHTEDSVRLGDGTSFFTSTSENGDIALDVHISNTEIAVVQGTDSPWSIDDGGGSITVDAVDLDIRDLNFATDSVTSRLQDGSGNAITSTAGALDVNIASAAQDTATANTAIAFGATSITTSATDIAGTDLANRKYLHLANEGNKKAYLGDATVTDTTGFPISPGEKQLYRAGAAINMHAITTAGTADMRRLELS
jgi:hypothetical protein